MDMDLHFARVQQRWRYADDELAAHESLSVERLAQDFGDLPELGENPRPEEISALVNDFFERTRVGDAKTPAGGVIEPADDARDPSVEDLAVQQ